MRLEFDDGCTRDDVTPDEVALALRQYRWGSDGFAILGVDQMTYLQAAGSPKDGFIVEHQEGSIKKHYQSAGDAVALDDVAALFASYARGDDVWRTALQWNRIDLHGETAWTRDATAATIANQRTRSLLALIPRWALLTAAALTCLALIVLTAWLTR